MAQKGYAVVAIDQSEAQLEYARSKAKAMNATIQFLQQDIRSFILTEEVGMVDVAILLYGTAQHLHSIDDIQQCWERVGCCLKPGGVFLIEVPQFEDIYNAQILEPMFWQTQIGKADDSIIVELGCEDDVFDAESQVLRRKVGISIQMGNSIELQGEQYMSQRIYTYQELLLHASLAGFKIVAQYKTFGSHKDDFQTQVQTVLLVLQKF